MQHKTSVKQSPVHLQMADGQKLVKKSSAKVVLSVRQALQHPPALKSEESR